MQYAKAAMHLALDARQPSDDQEAEGWEEREAKRAKWRGAWPKPRAERWRKHNQTDLLGYGKTGTDPNVAK
eukprot:5168540-Pyramimonas_sp.AAC.1